jgi:hypothetical protein
MMQHQHNRRPERRLRPQRIVIDHSKGLGRGRRVGVSAYRRVGVIRKRVALRPNGTYGTHGTYVTDP